MTLKKQKVQGYLVTSEKDGIKSKKTKINLNVKDVQTNSLR